MLNALWKGCVSRQEKVSVCNENSAARHSHIRDPRYIFLSGKKKIAGAAHLNALAHVNSFSRRHCVVRDEIADGASRSGASSRIFCAVELHARAPCWLTECDWFVGGRENVEPARTALAQPRRSFNLIDAKTTERFNRA